MELKEIKIRGIYKATFEVKFMPDYERPVPLFIQVLSKTQSGHLEIKFLHSPDSYVYHLEPQAIEPI